MTRKIILLLCENEHGTGEQCFPDIHRATGDELCEIATRELPVSQLRKEAKKHGWGRVNGGDFCPGCMESM